MANTILTQDRVVIWFQPDGPGTAFEPLGVGDKAGGMTGKSIPAVGVSPIYGRDRYGKPIVISINKEAPGELPTATITVYQKATLDFLLKAVQRGCPINVQLRGVECGVLDNPNIWDINWHWAGGIVTTYSPGDGPSLEFNGENLTAEGEVMFRYVVVLEGVGLEALAAPTGAAEDLLAIAGIPDEDCAECNNGYAGADQILYIGAAAANLATAHVLYTANGGAVFANTSADPFAADEHVDFIALMPINKTQFRAIVGTGVTDAGAKAKFAYADVAYGAEATTVWTAVLIDAGATGDVIEALGWLFFDRVYFATAGDIYVSEDQGATDPGAATYSGATVINGFSKSPDGRTVWAFGATNLLLRERDQNGIFAARTGPSGGGAFTALAVSNDGLIYAGNGQKLYVNNNEGENVGGWTEKEDFGASHVVKKIQLIGGDKASGGDSQLIRVVVDDTTPGTGEVWESVDGGANFNQVTEQTNTGYNDAYFSQIDDNLGFVVGDGAVIQKLSA